MEQKYGYIGGASGATITAMAVLILRGNTTLYEKMPFVGALWEILVVLAIGTALAYLLGSAMSIKEPTYTEDDVLMPGIAESVLAGSFAAFLSFFLSMLAEGMIVGIIHKIVG